MSIDTRPPQNPAPPAASYPEPAKPKLDLSLTQVVGGALAAMTAAYLGSRLSVAGTVVGAALASIVAGVAGSVYTASLRSTRERVRTVWEGRVAGSALPTSVELVEDRDDVGRGSAPAQPGAPVGDRPTTPRRRGGVAWRNVVGATLAAFALAGLALTGIELATGSALSGGDGTTINQVTEPRSFDRAPARQAPAGTASAEPSETPPSLSPSTTAEPSATPSPEPSSDPQPSLEPTTDPTAPAPSTPTSSTPTVEPTATTATTPAPQG